VIKKSGDNIYSCIDIRCNWK